eukprot:gene2441-514_t
MSHIPFSLAGLAALLVAVPLAESQRRNVLFIIVDDMRPQMSAAYGQHQTLTPNLDQLAQEGLVFDRAYCQVAWCSPSRNSFMTGLRPDTDQIWNFGKNFRDTPQNNPPGLPQESGTLSAPPMNNLTVTPIPEYFKKNGYMTLGGGKIYHPDEPPNNDVPYSWTDELPYFPQAYPDKPDDAYAPSYCTLKLPLYVQLSWSYYHFLIGTLCWFVYPNQFHRFYDWQLANHTIEALHLAKASGKNFFIGAGFRRPHVPWLIWDMYPNSSTFDVALHQEAPDGMPDIAFTNTPNDGVGDFGPHDPLPKERQQNCRHAYYSAITWTDSQIGRLLDTLQELELADNTAVVVFGDHGWQLGEHGEWAKHTNFENAARVPLFIRAPWMKAAALGQLIVIGPPTTTQASVGAHTRAFFELVDIYPTLAALAGLPAPPGTEGTDQSSVFENPGTTIKDHALSQYARCPDPKKADWQGNTCGSDPSTEIGYMGYSVRTDEWRYTEWYQFLGEDLLPSCDHIRGTELYPHTGDNGTDFNAFENVNLAADGAHNQTAATLHDLLRVSFWKAFAHCSNATEIAQQQQ